MKIICDIYCSTRDSDMYLYVKKEEGLSRVPEQLQEKFGKPRHVMTMLLQPGKKLARVEAAKVIDQLQEKGFYLQLPPPKDTAMLDIHLRNSKFNV